MKGNKNNIREMQLRMILEENSSLETNIHVVSNYYGELDKEFLEFVVGKELVTAFEVFSKETRLFLEDELDFYKDVARGHPFYPVSTAFYYYLKYGSVEEYLRADSTKLLFYEIEFVPRYKDEFFEINRPTCFITAELNDFYKWHELINEKKGLFIAFIIGPFNHYTNSKDLITILPKNNLEEEIKKQLIIRKII